MDDTITGTDNGCLLARQESDFPCFNTILTNLIAFFEIYIFVQRYLIVLATAIADGQEILTLLRRVVLIVYSRAVLLDNKYG
jgi:hypothetical protein